MGFNFLATSGGGGGGGAGASGGAGATVVAAAPLPATTSYGTELTRAEHHMMTK